MSRSWLLYLDDLIDSAEKLLLVLPAPLLEKEWNLIQPALIAKVGDPFGLNVARARSRLSSDDYPINPEQIQNGDCVRSASPWPSLTV